jgi:hypothetical protein
MAISRRDFIKTGVGGACTLAVGTTEIAQTAQPALLREQRPQMLLQPTACRRFPQTS